MWISFRNVAELFSISKEAVDALREENAALKAENSALATDLRDTKLSADWLRVQFNQLQIERTALMERVYDMRLPTPQLNVAQAPDALKSFQDALFDDLGDEAARALGLPTYA